MQDSINIIANIYQEVGRRAPTAGNYWTLSLNWELKSPILEKVHAHLMDITDYLGQ